ncbi:MAG: DUF5989 family protein [Planctomycetota bacterium]
MTKTTETGTEQSFLEASSSSGNASIFGEFIGFMRDNAKWWLLPFLIVFLLLGAALILGSTGAAPFIYTMF